jgi:uncharacterized SAM-binding protein YcdF (DUF218 family)
MFFIPFKVLFNPYILAAAIFVGGGVAFKLATPVCGEIPDNAAMFVLTGDARRIPFAVKKLENYPKRRLYIIGAGTPALDTAFAGQIEIENKSKSTFENAVAIRHIVHKNFMTSITVITTEDHVNRAAFLIKRQIPYAKINACPVTLNGMPATKRLERWAAEYVKFIGTLFGLQQRG